MDVVVLKIRRFPAVSVMQREIKHASKGFLYILKRNISFSEEKGKNVLTFQGVHIDKHSAARAYKSCKEYRNKRINNSGIFTKHKAQNSRKRRY